eukprot:764016-Hanusia_phi.AAC.2
MPSRLSTAEPEREKLNSSCISYRPSVAAFIMNRNILQGCRSRWLTSSVMQARLLRDRRSQQQQVHCSRRVLCVWAAAPAASDGVTLIISPDSQVRTMCLCSLVSSCPATFAKELRKLDDGVNTFCRLSSLLTTLRESGKTSCHALLQWIGRG